MSSPYPWHYTLRWLYYYFYPSNKRHTDLEPAPRGHDFLPEEQNYKRLIFFGDLMCIRFDRVPEVDPQIKALLSGADLVIGNCEAPLVHTELRPEARHLTHFGMSEAYLGGFLERLGVPAERCVLSVANNHIGDQGEAGLAETVRRLEGMGIQPMGHHEAGPYVSRKLPGGLELGLSAWTQWLNFEVLGGPKAKSGVWRTEPICDQDWASAAAEVDLLIANPHWEWEFQHHPKASTRALAQNLTEQGFGLIVGHHPHVLQPIEWFDDRKLCLYSVGNLSGPPYSHVAWPVQMVLFFEVRVVSQGPNRGRIAGYRSHLFAQEFSQDRASSLVPLAQAKPELRSQIEARYAELISA